MFTQMNHIDIDTNIETAAAVEPRGITQWQSEQPVR